MKEEVSPQKNLEILSHYIIDSYNSAPVKAMGSIQLHLKHQGENISCYLSADGEQMIFNFGELEKYDVKLTSGHYDWLDLAAGRLNPVLGVITKKLQFEGDRKVFGKLIKSNSLYKIDADISDDPTIFEKKPIQNWSRPEKVMVILGSPRGRNGYTFHYLNRFIKGLETGGASVELVELGKKKVNSCTGCFHCWKNSTGRCIQNDDVNDLYDKFHESDMIIYAFTLYWDTVPGILKNFIERAFCLEHPYMIPGLYKTRHPRRKKLDQSFFIFSVCGFPEQSHFDSVKDYFRKISHNSHIPFIGGIYRSACMFLPNDPLYYKTYNRILDSIQEAGKMLYKNGRIDKKLIKTIQTRIDPKEFQLHANKYWDNIVQRKDFFVSSV